MLLTLCFINGASYKNQIAEAQAENQTIDRITVNLKTNAPPRAAKRISSSIEAVGQQILLGKPLVEVAQNKNSYERLIKEIFDKVLIGYSVSSVTVTPLQTAHIDVVIAPWNDVVDSVAVEIDFGTLPPQVAKIIEEDIGDIESLISEIMLGLPVEAADWAGVIAKNGLREYLADALPEFRPAFEITSGQKTLFKITLTPNNPIIQDTNVVIESRTIPHILLVSLKPDLREVTDLMRSLPVGFVERHQDYFVECLKNKADNYYLIKRYGLTVESFLTPGTVSEVKIKAETFKYKINIEGYLDVRRNDNNNKDNISLKVHLGKMFGSKKEKELFMEMTFFPSSVKTQFEPGLAIAVTPKSVLDFRYNFSEKHPIIRLNQELGSKFTLRIERIPAMKYNEFGIGYRVHEMLKVEYIFSSNENWLRLVGRM